MRSRYTAYTRADIHYVEKTMAPEVRQDFDAAVAKQWAEGSKWKGLKIIDTRKGGPEDTTGMVEFTATYEMDGAGIDLSRGVSVSKVQRRKVALCRWRSAYPQGRRRPPGINAPGCPRPPRDWPQRSLPLRKR